MSVRSTQSSKRRSDLRLPSLPIRSRLTLENRYEVVLLSVTDPGSFMVALKSEQDQFKQFCDAINDYYKNFSKEELLEIVPREQPIRNQLFSVLCEMESGKEQMARAKFLEFEGAGGFAGVLVHLVDFGVDVEVKCMDLRCLPSRFRRFPSFAIHCALANAKTTGKWAPVEIERFMQVFSDQPLLMQLDGRDAKGVHLVDFFNNSNANMVQKYLHDLETLDGLPQPKLPSAEIADLLLSTSLLPIPLVPSPSVTEDEQKKMNSIHEEDKQQEMLLNQVKERVKIIAQKESFPEVASMSLHEVKVQLSPVPRLSQKKGIPYPRLIYPAGTQAEKIYLFGTDGEYFIVQLSTVEGMYQNVCDALAQNYETAKKMANLSHPAAVNQACVALYKDGSVNRAEILESNLDGTFKVCFVDYGGIEDKVQPSKVFELVDDPRLKKTSVLSIKIRSSGVEMDRSKMSDISPIVEDCSVRLLGYNEATEVYDCQFCTKGGDDLRQELFKKGWAKDCSKKDVTPPISENNSLNGSPGQQEPGFNKVDGLPRLELTDHDQYLLVFAHDGVISFQPAKYVAECDKMIVELDTAYKAMGADENRLVDPPPGSLCACLFCYDECWYRAITLGKSNPQGLYPVKFLDFGNTGLVGKDQMKALVEKFRLLPALSVDIHLKRQKADADVTEKIGSDQVQIRFESKISGNKWNKPFTVSIFNAAGDELFID